jgi:hypothetical protein
VLTAKSRWMSDIDMARGFLGSFKVREPP